MLSDREGYLAMADMVEDLHAAGQAVRDARADVDRKLDAAAQLIWPALDAGFSMTDLSRLLGVSRPTLYEWRAGSRGR